MFWNCKNELDLWKFEVWKNRVTWKEPEKVSHQLSRDNSFPKRVIVNKYFVIYTFAKRGN